MMPFAAIVLAAGKGVRFHSETPKVLHLVAFHPMLRYPLDALLPLKPSQTMVVVGHSAEAVGTYVEKHPLPCTLARQEQQKGTADAVLAGLTGLETFEGPVLIAPGDTPLITEEALGLLLEDHEQSGAAATVATVQVPDPTGYGRIIRDQDGALIKIVEHKDANEEELNIHEINTGYYVIDSGLLRLGLRDLIPNNEQNELYLTDIMEWAAKDNKVTSGLCFNSFEPFLGANDRSELADLELYMFDRINHDHQKAGVSIHHPTSVRIDPDVKIEADTEIAPGVCIEGKTTLGTGTRVDTGSIISNSQIGSQVWIKPYCVIDQATIASQARVGPFAHLRPGAKLSEEVRVGNFVEIKKSTLGRGSKANHLSYVGDATVGENANIGAGTITCNYDGQNKHTTTIEEGAFIGSNTSLVAPVTVGAGAITGAGSAITKDVPKGGLGVTRPKQVNVEGFAQRRKTPQDNKK